MKRKIVLRFIVGADEDNNYKYKNVTLRNIRPELNDNQMCEFVRRYCSLTANVLAEAVVVDERRLIIYEETEVIEEDFLLEEEDSSVMKEGGERSEKGAVRASNQENEAPLTPTNKVEAKPGSPTLSKSTLTAANPWELLESTELLRAGTPTQELLKQGVQGKQPPKIQRLKHPSACKQDQASKGLGVGNKLEPPLFSKDKPPATLATASLPLTVDQNLFEVAASLNSQSNGLEALGEGTQCQGLTAPGKEPLPSDLNQQSPPLTQKSVPSPTMIRKKSGNPRKGGIIEEEIEIWLDDDQDQSPEALLALIQEALEPSKGCSQSASFQQASIQGLSPSLEDLNDSDLEGDPDVLDGYEPFPKSRVRPVKKKGMHPPVGGNRTKSSKKKR